VIIRLLDRDSDVAPVPDGGSDTAVITAQNTGPGPLAAVAAAVVGRAEPPQLELSTRTGANGYQIVSVTGELDIATAEQAYSYISEVIDGRMAPVTVDLSGLTFCDASGLGALARAARYARQKGRELMLASARPSLLKIMRITGLDRAFPELHPSAHAYSALPVMARTQVRRANRVFWTMEDTASSALSLECFLRQI
jgi:anti-sigma B factor antagonist